VLQDSEAEDGRCRRSAGIQSVETLSLKERRILCDEGAGANKKEGETQATLGQGTIKVGGTALSEQEQYADLNRNVNEGQITTLDQQTAGLNASVAVDNRWLTSSGRQSLLNDQKDLGKNSEIVANAAGKDMQWVGNKAGQGIRRPPGIE
jgi:hypothetical protein